MRILIAEDEPVSRRILREAVERLGHECEVTSDGTEAWAAFEDFRPDVLISDWMMPGMDGLELCRHVRGAGGSYTYVILLTALEGTEYALQAMEAGADDFLSKPVWRESLRVRLVSAMRVMALHAAIVDRDARLEQVNEKVRAMEAREASRPSPSRSDERLAHFNPLPHEESFR